MKNFRFVTGLVAILLGLPLLVQSEELYSLEQQEQLDAGEIVFLEPEEPYLFKAAIEINAPADHVWSVMRDPERIPNYVKSLRKSTILEEGENWKIIEQKLKIHSLLPQFRYVFREEYGPDYLIRFERVDGSFKELHGWWRIDATDADKSVRLVYSTFVDVGWFIPASWIKKGISKDVPELLTLFREEVYSDFGNEDPNP